MGFRYWNDGLSFVSAADDGGIPGSVYFEFTPTDDDLAAAFPGYVAAKAARDRRLIPKSLVVQRLISAGKIAAAKAALESNPAAFARWFASDKAAVYADDHDALALLSAIGVDPDEIMAP